MCTAQAQTPSSAHTEAAQPCQLRAPAAPASTGPGWLWEPGSSPVLCFHQPRSPGFLQLASSSGAAQMLLKARSYNSVLQKSETKKQAAAPPSTWIKLAVYHLRGETALARSEGHEAEEPHSPRLLSEEMFVLTYPRDTGLSLQTHTHCTSHKQPSRESATHRRYEAHVMVTKCVVCGSARDASRRRHSEAEAPGKEIKGLDQHVNLGSKP